MDSITKLGAVYKINPKVSGDRNNTVSSITKKNPREEKAIGEACEKFKKYLKTEDLSGFNIEALKRYVSGGNWWYTITEKSTGKCILYMPANGTRAEDTYINLTEESLSRKVDDIIEEKYNLEHPKQAKKVRERKDSSVLEEEINSMYEKIASSLKDGTWLTSDLIIFREKENNLKKKIVETLNNENNIWVEFSLGKRVKSTFDNLIKGLEVGNIEATPQLSKQINRVISIGKGLPIKLKGVINNQEITDNIINEEVKSGSEALSELEYAVIIAVQEENRFFTLGAKGHFRSGVGTKEIQQSVDKEEIYGKDKLPPLGILNFEVDAYYLTSDGILRADEVKDTPRAFAEKVRDGGQINKQMAWLAQEVYNRETNSIYKKQVGYFIQADEPKFYELLHQKVLSKLDALDKLQPGLAFIRIGDKKFTLQQLKDIDAKATKWLKQKITQNEDSLEALLNTYFSNVNTALETIKKIDN